jgi:hypothetical protein
LSCPSGHLFFEIFFSRFSIFDVFFGQFPQGAKNIFSSLFSVLYLLGGFIGQAAMITEMQLMNDREYKSNPSRGNKRMVVGSTEDWARVGGREGVVFKSSCLVFFRFFRNFLVFYKVFRFFWVFNDFYKKQIGLLLLRVLISNFFCNIFYFFCNFF